MPNTTGTTGKANAAAIKDLRLKRKQELRKKVGGELVAKGAAVKRKEGKLVTTAKRQTRDDYLALVLEFPLVSIRSDDDLECAVAVMDSLLARGRLTAGAEQYLDALSDLVELYEDRHMKIEAPTDGAMLLHLLESTGKSQSGVATATGIKKSTISEVVNGKRTLSRQNIQKICRHFGVPTSLFADIER